MPEGVTTWNDIYWLEKDLEFAAIRMRDQAVDNDAAHMENSLEIITKAILSHYDDIDDLTLDLGEQRGRYRHRPVRAEYPLHWP